MQNTSKFVWEIRDEQEEIAKRNDKEATEQERVIYTRMIEQHALDMASKLYKKDTSELSMKERQMLKQKKDAMLKSALR